MDNENNIAEDIAEIKRSLRELEGAISGNSRLGQQGLIPRMIILENEVARMRGQRDAALSFAKGAAAFAAVSSVSSGATLITLLLKVLGQ